MQMKTMNKETFSTVTGVIFTVVAVLHLLRAVMGWQAAIGGFAVPLWLSWVAVVVAAYLAHSAFSLAK